MNSIAIPKITTIQYKNSIIFAYISIMYLEV